MKTNHPTPEFRTTQRESHRRTIAQVTIVPCVLLLISAASMSCRKAEESSQVVTMEGRIEKIKLTSNETGEIAVLYRNKDQQEIVGNGTVTRETEVMINGVLGKLSDVREGEHIRGEVQVRRKGDERTQTVLKIYVDRAEPITPDE